MTLPVVIRRQWARCKRELTGHSGGNAMLSRYRLFAWIGVLVAGLTSVCHADIGLSAKELLDRSLAAQEQLNVQISRGEIQYDFTTAKDGKRHLAAQEIEMRRDKDRYDQVRLDWNSVPSLDAAHPYQDASGMRQIYTGSQLWDGWYFRGKDMYHMQFKDGVIVSVKTPPADAARNKTQVQYPLAALDGYTVITPWPQNGRTVETVQGMANVSVQPATETINGFACQVIEASNNDDQHIKIWIDPAHDYHVVQTEYEDKSLVTSYGDVRFEKHEGVWVPMQCTIHTKWLSLGKLVSEGTTRLKRSTIDLHPDFDAVGAFKPNLPNGTLVSILEMPGVKYVWRDGQMIPYVDDETVASIDSTAATLASASGAIPESATAVLPQPRAARTAEALTPARLLTRVPVARCCARHGRGGSWPRPPRSD